MLIQLNRRLIIARRPAADLVAGIVDGAGGWFHFLDLVDAGSDGRDLVSGKIRDFLLDLRQQLLELAGSSDGQDGVVDIAQGQPFLETGPDDFPARLDKLVPLQEAKVVVVRVQGGDVEVDNVNLPGLL